MPLAPSRRQTPAGTNAWRAGGRPLRKRAAENEATHIASRLQRTSDEKSIPAGVEPDLVKSRLQRWGKIVLLLAAFTTIASSLNVAAAYVLKSGAWSSLVEHPLLAFLLVIVAQAGGVGGIIGVANELRDDEAKRRFRMGLRATSNTNYMVRLAGGLGGALCTAILDRQFRRPASAPRAWLTPTGSCMAGF